MSKPIARLLAKKLIETYTKHKLPNYAKKYGKCPESFTKKRIENDPKNSLFQMIILAAYARTPFTRWARGFEPIAGLDPSKPSLPHILRSAGLFTPADIHRLDEDTIDKRLKNCSFYSHHIASYGKVRYAQTFKKAAEAIDSLLSDIRNARTAAHVAALHKRLDEIPGIGPPIASKLIMYTLRESPYFGSSIHPRELYPAVKPIEKEYHVGNVVEMLRKRYGQNIMDDILEQLRQLGDPFAIDALFYIDREAPHLSKCLFNLQTSEARNKEGEMITDNKEPLPVNLPAQKAEPEHTASELTPSSSSIIRLKGTLYGPTNGPLGLYVYSKKEAGKFPWKQHVSNITLIINKNQYPCTLRNYTHHPGTTRGAYIKWDNRWDKDMHAMNLNRLDWVELKADATRHTLTIIRKLEK